MFRDAVREVVCKDYLSALEDLTFNSKHYINMLTKLAKENVFFAKDIVGIVEAHIVKVFIYLCTFNKSMVLLKVKVKVFRLICSRRGKKLLACIFA